MLPALSSFLFETLTLAWRDLDGWRFWHGLGATLTLLLLAARFAAPAVRFFRETQWTPPAVVVGLVVWGLGPALAVFASTLAWPLVLGWLLVDVSRVGTRE
jgi:hypothetical protein